VEWSEEVERKKKRGKFSDPSIETDSNRKNPGMEEVPGGEVKNLLSGFSKSRKEIF